MTNIELMIENDGVAYMAVVEGNITWETERAGTPGKLSFQVVKDEIINFQEGNAVKLWVDGVPIFYGFVFTKKRNKENTISVTAYDQLRYLKNKNTMIYHNLTANQVIQEIADDFLLNCGELENTEYVIEKRNEENNTLFDIIQTALDITLRMNLKMYVLYDDFGKLTLKNIESMKLDFVVDEETAENFDYSSSIDKDTYTRIKLYQNNDDTGKRDIYEAKDSSLEEKWGVLQFCESINEKEDASQKADALLNYYNKKTRSLSISGAIGNISVRTGCSVIVKLSLGDIHVQNYFIVEKVKHVFSNRQHQMDLTLRGNDFV